MGERGKRMIVHTVTLPIAVSRHFAASGALQVSSSGETSFALVPSLFFFVIIIIVIVSIARGLSKRSSIQRPLSEATSFPPPPPPDTVMVKCEYCGTEQAWKEACIQCGAPMPKPKIG